MDSRVVIDVLSPEPKSVAVTISTPETDAPLRTLSASIRQHFPPPAIPVINDPSRCSVAASLQDIQLAIRAARLQCRRLKPTTNPHSMPSRLALKTGSFLLDVSKLNSISRNSATRTVTVQCGATLAELAAACPNTLVACLRPHKGSIGAALADGLLSRAGIATPSLLDSVRHISIVDSSGRLRVYSADQPHFRAVIVSLGLFGVIYDVTLAVEPFTKLVNLRTTFLTVNNIFDNSCRSIRRNVKGNTHFELNWIPFNSLNSNDSTWDSGVDLVWLRTLSHTKRATHDEDTDVLYRFRTLTQFLSLHANTLSRNGYTTFMPSHTRQIMSQAFKQTAWKLDVSHTTTLSNAINYCTFDAPFANISACLSISRKNEKDWTRLHACCMGVVALVEQFDSRDEYPLNGGFRLQFTSSNRSLLTPNHGSDVSAVMEVYSAKGTQQWRTFAAEILELWMSNGARWMYSRESADLVSPELLVESLGSSLETFKSLHRMAAVDDYGMFEDNMTSLLENDILSDVSSLPSLNGRWKELEGLLIRAKQREHVYSFSPVSSGNTLSDSDDEEVSEEPVSVAKRTGMALKLLEYLEQTLAPLSRWEILAVIFYLLGVILVWIHLFGREALQSARQFGHQA